VTTRTREDSRAGERARFARQAWAARRSRAPRGRALARPPLRFGRQPPKKSPGRQALERVTSRLRRSGTNARSRTGAPAGKWTAGLAAFAGAAALALKNRDKLKALVGDRGPSSPEQPTEAVHPPTVVPGDAESTAAS
jgi:hypothetical protein